MRRSLLSTAVVLWAGAVVLTGCSSAGSGGTNVQNNGQSNADPSQLAAGTLYHRPRVPDAGLVRVAVDESYANYNNNLGATDNLPNLYVLDLVQPRAFIFNDVANKTVVQADGDLLTSVTEANSPRQTVRFRINPKAVWSDGAPVECADFYLQWLAGAQDSGDIAEAFDSAVVGMDRVGGIGCADGGKTVDVEFKQPDPDWIGLFSDLVPAHVLEQATGVADITKLNDSNPADKADLLKVAAFYSGGPNLDQPGFVGLNPAYDLSAGPYEIKSADGKHETVLVRNPRWWGPPGGPSEIDITTNADAESAYQQLQNHEVDIATGQPDSQVAAQVRSSGGQSRLSTGVGAEWEHLDLNTQNAEFTRFPELRRAFALCVNRSDIIGKVVADVDPAIAPLGSTFFLNTETAYRDQYAGVGNGNVAAARKELTDNGWVVGPNGVFTKDGQAATITIGHQTVQRREDTVTAIQGECRPAGIQVDDQASDGFNGKDLAAGNFQVALFAWSGSVLKDAAEGEFGTTGAGNYFKYSNQQVDRLLAAADGELDYASRVADLRQADQLIAKDGWILPLFILPEYAISNGHWGSTGQNGKPVDIQDNEASSGVLWDAFAWRKTS